MSHQRFADKYLETIDLNMENEPEEVLKKKELLFGLDKMDLSFQLQTSQQLEKEKRQFKDIEQEKIEFYKQHHLEKDQQLKNEQVQKLQQREKRASVLKKYQDQLHIITQEKKQSIQQLELKEISQYENNQAQKKHLLEKEQVFLKRCEQQHLEIEKKMKEFWPKQEELIKKKIQKDALENALKTLKSRCNRQQPQINKLEVEPNIQKETKQKMEENKFKEKTSLQNDISITFKSKLDKNQDQFKIPTALSSSEKTKNLLGVKKTVLFKKSKKTPVSNCTLDMIEKQNDIELITLDYKDEDNIELITLDDKEAPHSPIDANKTLHLRIKNFRERLSKKWSEMCVERAARKKLF